MSNMTISSTPKRSRMPVMKRIVTIALSALMTLPMTACAGCGGGTSKEDLAASKTGVYRMEILDGFAIGDDESLQGVAAAGGRVYALTSKTHYDDLTGLTVKLCSTATDGSDYRAVTIYDDTVPNTNYNPNPQDAEVDPGFGILDDMMVDPQVDSSEEEGVENKFTNVDGMAISDTAVYMELTTTVYKGDAQSTTLTLLSYDLDGKQLGKVDMIADSPSYAYMSRMSCDAQGVAVGICGDDNVVIMYDTACREVSRTPSIDTGINTVMIGRDGRVRIIVPSSDYSDVSVHAYDRNTGMEVPDASVVDTSVYFKGPIAGYDYSYRDTEGYWGCNFDSGSPVKILDFINSDILSSELDNVADGGDGGKTLYGTASVESDLGSGSSRGPYSTGLVMQSSLKICKLTYRDPKDIPDKAVIRLGCVYLNYAIKQRVVAFNKQSEQYRITVTNYDSYNDYTESGDASAGITKLNNEILAGNVPDILVLSGDMPVDAYISKGVLADLGPMIDDDPDMKREDFLGNIFDAYSSSGKLCMLVPSFSIETAVGKTSVVGEDSASFTMDKVQQLLKQYPDASLLGNEYDRASFMKYALIFSGRRIVDEQAGQCHFDTGEFAQILEMARNFPEKIDYDKLDGEYYQSLQTAYRENRILLMMTQFSDPANYGTWRYGNFGEPISLIGFPSEGSGSLIVSDSQYAIAAKSKHKDGAWQFLRYYLTPEYQDNCHGLPILKSSLENKLALAKERPFYLDNNGEKVYYDNQYYISDDLQVKIPPLSDEEVSALWDFISGLSETANLDTELMSIVEEEAPSYWSGDKSVDEVCSVIQSRVQIFISESR